MDNAGLWLLGPAWPPQALNSAFKNGHLSTASSTCSLSHTSPHHVSGPHFCPLVQIFTPTAQLPEILAPG